MSLICHLTSSVSTQGKGQSPDGSEQGRKGGNGVGSKDETVTQASFS